MGPRVLLTRPREESASFAARLEARGYRTAIEPILAIEPVPAALEIADYQAVLATSANGVRALAGAVTAREVPLFAVGDATARAAREAGFVVVENAAGDSAALARLVTGRLDPRTGPLLHVSGEAIAGDLAGSLSALGFAVDRRVLYRARAAERLSEATIRLIADGSIDAALFFSPRTARTFVSLAAAAQLAPACAGIAAICLSPAVAEAAQAIKWRTVCVAARPDSAALVEALDAWKVQQFTGSP